MAKHIRKGDTVYIRTGKDRGRSAKVMRVLVDANKVVCEGINVVTRRMKPTQANPQGGLVEKEMPIHISNVAPIDGNGKPTRVRFETRADGSKVRLAATTGEQIGPELKKAKK